jgi:NADH:ubiquinone oxidoreductase subunit E
MYSPENEKKLDEYISHYPIKRSAVLPALFIAQDEHGYVTDEDVKYLARRLDMRVNEVEEIVTFYSMYSREPVGKYKLQVCRTISCMLLGAPQVTEHLCKKLGVEVGETTADGKCRRSNVSATATSRPCCKSTSTTTSRSRRSAPAKSLTSSRGSERASSPDTKRL